MADRGGGLNREAGSALAPWDARRRQVLARDRVGKKPLFQAAIADGLAFASVMNGLFPVPGIVTIEQHTIVGSQNYLRRTYGIDGKAVVDLVTVLVRGGQKTIAARLG